MAQNNETLENSSTLFWNDLVNKLEKTSSFTHHQIGYLHTLVPLSVNNGIISLSAPNLLVQTFVKDNSAFLASFCEENNIPLSGFELVINEKPAETHSFLMGNGSASAPTENSSFTPPADELVSKKEDISPKTEQNDLLLKAHLNPRYSFNSFVVGNMNRFAAAAAAAVSEEYSDAYNPLFIYGNSGLGKTHLLHATGIYALTLNPQARVLYINAERFLNLFITATRTGDYSFFQTTCRNLDLLLLDDIQILSGAEETMEQFFHIFRDLYDNGKRIVITSDVAPKNLKGVEERLITRFQSGLTIDIHPPSLETRVAILEKNVMKHGVSIPNDALFYIAENVHDNIRELEGALNKVVASSSFENTPISLEYVRFVLKDQFRDNEVAISVEEIVNAVSSFTNVSSEDIYGPSRQAQFVEARSISMYLARTLTNNSTIKLGSLFGGRDHSSVLHNVNKIGDQLKNDREMYDKVNEITKIIKSK